MQSTQLTRALDLNCIFKKLLQLNNQKTIYTHFVWTYVYISRSRMLDHMVILCLAF